MCPIHCILRREDHKQLERFKRLERFNLFERIELFEPYLLRMKVSMYFTWTGNPWVHENKKEDIEYD